jgi:GntR family transcriptional regulator
LLSVNLGAGSIYASLTARGVDLHADGHTFDAVAAEPQDAALLEVAEGAPLLRERPLTTSSTGEPLEWPDDRDRPDIGTVTISNTRRSRPGMARTGP